MRGSVFKRCTCRTPDGKKIKNCRKPHGSWSFVVDAGTDPATGKRKQIPSPDITRRVYKHLMRKETARQVEKATKILTRHRPKQKAP